VLAGNYLIQSEGGDTVMRLNPAAAQEPDPGCPGDYVCPWVDICLVDYDPCQVIDICGIDLH